MCGIVGVIGQITGKEEKVFKQLLEVDSLRGRHSTGVIKVDSKGVVETRKKAIDGMDFVKLEGKWIDSGISRALIGHNRYATKGAINDVNAHPFTHGHIHGVHNGTLTTQFGLKDNTKFQVDSDNLFYDMAHNGMEETAKKISGAWTIAMYNEQDKTFNMFRNHERPMSIAISTDGLCMFFASEATMLEWVLDRNGINYDEILNLTPGKLIQVNPNQIAYQNKVPAAMTITDIEYKKVPATTFVKKKSLSDFGLKSNVGYPVAITSVTEDTRSGKDFEVELLIPPYNTWTVYAYQVDTQARLQDMYDNDEVAEAVLTVGYNSNMPHCWGADIKKASESTLNLLAAHDEECAKENAAAGKDSGSLSDDELAQILDLNGFTQAEEWKDARGNPMTRVEFNKTEAGQNGCCMCGDIFTSPDEVVWSENSDNAMCVDCVETFDRIYGGVEY